MESTELNPKEKKGQQIFLQGNSFLIKTLGLLEFIQGTCVTYVHNKTKKANQQQAEGRKKR